MGFMNIDVPNIGTESPKLRRDRLSALLTALRPVAAICAPDDPAAQVVITASTLVLRFQPGLAPEPEAAVALRLESALPLAQTLRGAPDRLEVAFDDCPELGALACVLATEARASRCGASHAMARLAEAMLIIALRRTIDNASTAPGLLAGLSHPRLHRALVAIHDSPGARWTVESLANEAGMSRSRFMASFSEAIGTSPMAYVAQWRLRLAQKALTEGVSLKDVARRSGYRSTAAFRRALQRHPEGSPTDA